MISPKSTIEGITEYWSKYCDDRRPKSGMRGLHRPDIDTEDLIRDYLTPVPLVEMCQKYGLSAMAIHRRLRKSGIEIKDRRHLNLDEESICVEYLSGICVERIAKDRNVKSSVIYRVLKRKGIPRTQSAEPRLSLPEKEIVEMHLNGASVSGVAKTFAVSWSVIRDILERNGVHPRKRRYTRHKPRI